MSSFDVGFFMGIPVGAALLYVGFIVRAWWVSIHPEKVDWDPTIERIRKL